MILDLTKGITETDQYKAFKFPGGEIHFKSKIPLNDIVRVNTRLNSSDDILLLCIVIDTIEKEGPHYLSVYIPYMPYQQADMNFSEGECFSLKTITRILNTLLVAEYKIYDPHSSVSPALLKNCESISNNEYIAEVIKEINDPNLILLSPDAGAYKKIYKLAEKIEFKGEIAQANKSRSISSGHIDSIELSKQDFEGKNVLIIDDICVGGRTFVELSKKLKERNIGKLYLAVSHGIFSNGFEELSKHFEKVFTTNSRTDAYTTDMFGKVPQSFLSIHKII
jgi:ribose-phosphate pyrophosphokinase